MVNVKEILKLKKGFKKAGFPTEESGFSGLPEFPAIQDLVLR